MAIRRCSGCTCWPLALTTAPTDPGVVDLGLAAATAVARIAPKDVDERLAPLFSDQVAGPIRARLRAQTERVGGMCQPDAKK